MTFNILTANGTQPFITPGINRLTAVSCEEGYYDIDPRIANFFTKTGWFFLFYCSIGCTLVRLCEFFRGRNTDPLQEPLIEDPDPEPEHKLAEIKIEEIPYDIHDATIRALREKVKNEKNPKDMFTLAKLLEEQLRDSGKKHGPQCSSKSTIFKLYQQSADLRHPNSQYEMALIFNEGKLNQKQDHEQSRLYAFLAAKQGVQQAQALFDKLTTGTRGYYQYYVNREQSRHAHITNSLFAPNTNAQENGVVNIIQGYAFDANDEEVKGSFRPAS